MLENKSDDFKTLILLKLTKNIIENSNSAGLYKLEKLIKGEQIESFKISLPKSKEEIKKQIKKDVKEKLGYSPSVKIKENDSFIIVEREPKKEKKPIPTKKPMQMQRPPQRRPPVQTQMQRPPQRRPPVQMHPGYELPENLQYLKPSKEEIQPVEIDLGKLNPFLQDKNVMTIETEGPDETVYVTGTMGRKPTGIKLSKEEINEIVN